MSAAEPIIEGKASSLQARLIAYRDRLGSLESKALIADVLDELSRASWRQSALLEVLRPFADLDGEGSDDFGDDTPVTLIFGRTTAYRPVTLGDLRRASYAVSAAEAAATPTAA